MPRKDLPPLNGEQQLVWKVLSLLEESELVDMLRALRHHPDRNDTIDGVNAGLDQGYDLLEVFGDEYQGLHELQYEGFLEFDVYLVRDGVRLIIGYRGGDGEVAEFMFTRDADGLIDKVEFLGSHNQSLMRDLFDDGVSLS